MHFYEQFAFAIIVKCCNQRIIRTQFKSQHAKRNYCGPREINIYSIATVKCKLFTEKIPVFCNMRSDLETNPFLCQSVRRLCFFIDFIRTSRKCVYETQALCGSGIDINIETLTRMNCLLKLLRLLQEKMRTASLASQKQRINPIRFVIFTSVACQSHNMKWATVSSVHQTKTQQEDSRFCAL